MPLESVPPKLLPAVRSYRLYMVLACLLPGLLGGVLLLLQVYQEGCTQLEAGLVQTARAMVQAVDSAFTKEQLLAPVSFAHQRARSDVFADDSERRTSVTVLLGDQASYFLGFSLGNRIFSEILRQQQLPGPWVAAVFDRHGTIAMHSIGNETLVGKQVDEELLRSLTGPTEGVFQSVNREGVAAWVAYSRSAQSGWSVSISVPRKDLEAPLRQRLLLLATSSTLLLCLSMGLVWLFGGRLAVLARKAQLSGQQRIANEGSQASERSALRSEMQTMREWQVARHAVAGLAHEINQPLATVSVLCEAASRMLWAQGPAQAITGTQATRIQETLQHLARESERTGAVVRQVMQTVRPPDTTLRPIALNGLLNSAAQMAIEEGIGGCEIHIHCPAHLHVNANSLQLTKVLINLISNACEAMHAAQIVHGGIWIMATPTDNARMVEISVGDEGPGVQAGMEHKIFQAFFTTKPDRLGMGLSISRSLVEAQHGRLWLQAPLGTGATFHFTLPTAN